MKKIIFLFIIFVAQNNSFAQNWLWADSPGGIGSNAARDVVTDPGGHVYVTGVFYSPSITFGTYTLTNSGYCDIFLAKYDSVGNVTWAKKFGGIKEDDAKSITIDNSGMMYVTGYFRSPSITFGAYTLINSTSYNSFFIVKYDSSGTVIWARC